MVIRGQMRAHGNMTGVEKQMNRDDLSAWKNYDNNQYSLIPGVSSNKKIPEKARGLGDSGSQTSLNASMVKAKSEAKYIEKQERMKQHGFTRDPRDVYALSKSTIPAGMGNGNIINNELSGSSA